MPETPVALAASPADPLLIASLMAAFRADGTVSVPTELLAELRAEFDCGRVTDAQAARVVQRVHDRHGFLVDPHTAVGVGVAEEHAGDPSIPMITLATAHPAKFPDAVEAAVGIRPELPAHLADLFDRTERIEHCDASLESVEAHVRTHLA